MKNSIQTFKTSFKGLFILSLFAIIFSSCSQRIAGNFKTDRLEIQQAAAQDLNIETEKNAEKQIAQLEEKEIEIKAEEINTSASEVAKNKTEKITKRQAKKTLVKNFAKNTFAKTEKLKDATISALPLLAFNKSNTKSEKAPMRDFLVLGIILILIGLLVSILGGFGKIFGAVGGILVLIGIVLIILYLVDMVA